MGVKRYKMEVKKIMNECSNPFVITLEIDMEENVNGEWMKHDDMINYIEETFGRRWEREENEG